MDLSRKQPPTVRLRRLAGELKALRKAAGLTREDVAKLSGINVTTLYRIETAKVRPQRRTLLSLLDRYGVADESKRAELEALSKQAGELGWLQAYESDLPEQYTTYISFEADARSVRNYESLFVPGLLQTEPYASAVITGALPLAGPDQVKQRVEVRMKRQSSLTKSEPLKVWAIIDEAVLCRRVGGYKVMATQLKHLAVAASEPHIIVQVIPFGAGAHPGMAGSFVVMDFRDTADPDLVYCDSMAGDLFLEKEVDVRRYTGIFDNLRALALSPVDTIQHLHKAAEEMKE